MNPQLAPADDISQRMLRYFASNEVLMPLPNSTLLSEREREVLSHIAQGHSLKEVAAKLGVTHNTVATQVKSIYSKLNISSRAEAALAASRMGIVV